MRQLFPLYLQRWWWIVAVVAIPPMALAYFNLNFIYVALMLVFFVIPMMLGAAYFYYALSDECLSSIRRGRILLDDTGIIRQFVDDEDVVVSDKKAQWKDFESFEFDESGIKLFIKKRGMTFEFMPAVAFDGIIFSDAVGLVSKHLPMRGK